MRASQWRKGETSWLVVDAETDQPNPGAFPGAADAVGRDGTQQHPSPAPAEKTESLERFYLWGTPSLGVPFLFAEVTLISL